MRLEPFRFDRLDMLAWKVLSFLAMEPAAQEALIGDADEWFIRKKHGGGAAANYLFGVLLVYLSCWVAFFDKMSPEVLELERLTAVVRSMADKRQAGVFSVQSLREHADWEEIRRLASSVLARGGLFLNPPEQPFSIPDLLELEGYEPQ